MAFGSDWSNTSVHNQDAEPASADSAITVGPEAIIQGEGASIPAAEKPAAGVVEAVQEVLDYQIL